MIITDLKRSSRQSICLGENTEKYILFSVAIEKQVTRIGKNVEEITKNIPYRLKVTNSTRVMASSLPNLVNNLAK